MRIFRAREQNSMKKGPLESQRRELQVREVWNSLELIRISWNFKRLFKISPSDAESLNK